MGHLPRNSVAAFDIYYTINRSRWHAGRPSGLGHEWVGFLFITKREPSHAMNEFPTAPPSGGADTLDGGIVYISPAYQKKKRGTDLSPNAQGGCEERCCVTSWGTTPHSGSVGVTK